MFLSVFPVFFPGRAAEGTFNFIADNLDKHVVVIGGKMVLAKPRSLLLSKCVYMAISPLAIRLLASFI